MVSEPAWIYSRLFYAGLLFFEVANRDFFAFKLIFAPYSEEIEPALLGMSLATLGEVCTHISFRLLEGNSCENFGQAHFSIVVGVEQNGGSV